MATEKTFHVYATGAQKKRLVKILKNSIQLKDAGKDGTYNKTRFNLFPEQHQLDGLRNACKKLKLGLCADSV